MIIQMDYFMDTQQKNQSVPYFYLYFLANHPFYQQITPSTPSSQESPPPVIEKQKIQISLTSQQLLAEGYQTNKKSWKEEEDIILMKLAKNQELNWKQIAEHIPGRTSKMCYSRYRRIQSRSKEQWSRKEDSQLCTLIETYGKDWQRISDHFGRRTPKQIEDHYTNFLRPDINKGSWTLDEDLMLIKLLKQVGKNWEELERRFPGRTQNQLKNRYFGRLKRLDDKKKEKQQIGHNKKEKGLI